MFKKVSRKIGFTETEIYVILFLTISFIIGLSIKTYKDIAKEDYKEYDYSEEDSLFNHYKSQAEENLKNEKEKREENIIDSKGEILGFQYTNFDKKKDLPPLKEKSININTADFETLTRLPGIGEKTALNIINFRNVNGNFKSLEEILEVKGIGKVKLNKIKKFLYIESSF
ncbi:MAG: helix-hairpin-helix domain-containing protein [Bacteroidetes bacterium]|nr:helix-hairpin-helix domain-containing protein [Bacteroidota bacterium]